MHPCIHMQDTTPESQSPANSKISIMENYEKISDIGKGSFGVVSKVKRKSDGRVLVWKELNYGRMNEKEK